MTDFLGYEHKLGLYSDRLSKENFSKQDQNLIRRFLDRGRAQYHC